MKRIGSLSREADRQPALGVMYELVNFYECDECHAVVTDQTAHQTWHQEGA